MNRLIPLKSGCRIGIAAPSSSFKAEEFEKSVALLRDLGYEPVYTDAVFKRMGFVAGSPEERARDLLKLINDDQIRAIFFVRGGYGSAQILPLIEKKNLKNKLSSKILMGYSDITALYCHFYKKYRTPLFYGPNLINPNLGAGILRHLSDNGDLRIKVDVLRPCKKTITAPLFGGCLSVLASMAGTRYAKPLKGHILFIEDINEAPYRIDRMLTQLLMSGMIRGIKAIAVGSMEKCDTAPYTWQDPVLRVAEAMGIPVISGIQAGHGNFAYPLPIGVRAKIDFASSEFLIYSPFTDQKK